MNRQQIADVKLSMPLVQKAVDASEAARQAYFALGRNGRWSSDQVEKADIAMKVAEANELAALQQLFKYAGGKLP